MDLLWSLFPKSSGSGSSINLTDTVKNAPLYLTLGATALSQDGTPTPSSPQSIHKITGNNTLYKMNKNIIDSSDIYYGLGYNLGVGNSRTLTHNAPSYVTVNEDKSIVFNSPSEQWQNFDLVSKPLNIGTYKLSLNVQNGTTAITGGTTIYTCKLIDTLKFEVLNIEWVGQANNTINAPSVKTLNITSDNTYIIVSFSNNAVVTNGSVIITAQLEYNNATDYNINKTSDYPVNLGEIEYCKIGNYEDKFIRNNDGTWQLEKNIGKIILDGTQNIPLANWRASETSVGWVYGYSVFNNAPVSNTVVGSIMCNKLSASKFDDLFQKTKDNGIALYTNTDYSVAVRTSDTTLTTTSAINTYLSSNPMTVYYPLVTPEYLPITGTLAEQLETIYKDLTAEAEQTNISQVNADLPFTISATTLKSLTNL